jgi:Recombinase zinc beta ribbon domain
MSGDHESHAIGLDRNELGALLAAARLGPPPGHALISLPALNGLRVFEATGADIGHLGLDRGHRTLVITRKGGKVVTIPLAPRTARAIDLAIGERTEGPLSVTRNEWRLDRHGATQADYIAAQEASAPRGPAGPATRRYLLAGLLACGTCGRRLESAWSNGKPAYRCRHGYTSAAGSSLGRPENLYVREDQILPGLAALAILHADGSRFPQGGEQASAPVTAPARAADLIDRLQAADVTLIYDPATRALRTGTRYFPAVTVG